MVKSSTKIAIVLVSSFLILSCGMHGFEEINRMYESKAANVFSDHMVLQRHKPIRVWGWSDPDSTVRVTLKADSAEAVCDEQGEWLAVIPEQEAGGPFEMRVEFENAAPVIFQDVLVGEVWLASGQSNMEWPLINSQDGGEAVEKANVPGLRLLQVPKRFHPEPREDFDSPGWRVCTPESARNFSSVAYYFGREIHETYDIPVGIIHSSWGGTPIAAWTPVEAFEGRKDFEWLVEQNEKLKSTDHAAEARRREQAMNAYLEQTGGNAEHKDPGNQKESEGWAEPGFDDSAWEVMELPQPMEQGIGRELDGEVWFRREVDIPEEWAGKSADIYLGIIDDFDTTYVNGEAIGRTGEETDQAYAVHRHYLVRKGILKPGRNVIAVRVFDKFLAGGLMGPPQAMYLLGPDRTRIALTGEWRYAIGLELLQRPQEMGGEHRTAAVLYNAMIHPLIPYTLRGAIWYQGENDVWQAGDYTRLTGLKLEAWRERWGLGDFPYYLVQLASFQGNPQQPEAWPRLREAQDRVPDFVSNTGVATAIDIGEEFDIHPKNKSEVGHRLALLARANTYGDNIEYSGPAFQDLEITGSEVRVSFSHADGLRTFDDKTLRGFQLAGEDRVFHPARARLEGAEVILYSERVREPVAVRYSWVSFPEGNLINAAGLPAFPFRTDDWIEPEKR